MTDLPNEIMVWHSMEKLTHIGTWATERYPEEAVAYVLLADAKAAQAMVVERAKPLLDLVEEFVTATFHLLDNSETSGPTDDPTIAVWQPDFDQVSGLLDRCEGLPSGSPDYMTAGELLVANIRTALAPIDGLALVRELRADADRLNRWRAEEGEKIKRQAKALTDLTKHCQRIEAENAGLARKIGKVQRGDGDHSQIADLEAKVINQRNELANLRARDGRMAELAVERDTLAAANSMLEAKVAGLRAMIRVNMLRYGPPGTSHEEINAAIDVALAEHGGTQK